jgi:hypothetical protein
VSKVPPLSREQRQAFLRKLTPPQRAAFDGLASKLANAGPDLGRHHALGGIVAKLVAGIDRRGRVG